VRESRAECEKIGHTGARPSLAKSRFWARVPHVPDVAFAGRSLHIER
jgi:hypothetical protein